MAAEHISEEVLEHLARQALDSQVAEQVRRHLDRCSECAQKYSGISEFVILVQGALRDLDKPN